MAIAKNRSAIRFVDDFRQLADAVKHKQQLGKQRARRAKSEPGDMSGEDVRIDDRPLTNVSIAAPRY
ncbi:hypothetical protein IE995_07440 [Klebsiella pneumoniae]|nr:hypothetical protein [Klebsiella pneumoniae]